MESYKVLDSSKTGEKEKGQEEKNRQGKCLASKVVVFNLNCVNDSNKF
jgi:hypothetical protein